VDLNIRVTVARTAVVQQQTPGVMANEDVIDAWGKWSVLVGVDQVSYVLALGCSFGLVC
jgi:hypothetical protein